MNRPAGLVEFIAAVSAMREAQHKSFKGERSPQCLAECRALEKRVDLLLVDLTGPQGGLFR